MKLRLKLYTQKKAYSLDMDLIKEALMNGT